jgi:hypothetical protein
MSDKQAQLDKAAASIDKNHSSAQKASGAKCECLADIPIHLGLWLQLDQYPIAARETSLRVAVADNAPMKKSDDFYKKNEDAFETNAVVSVLPEPPKLSMQYPIKNTSAALGHFEAGLVTKSMLIKGTNDAGYRVELDADKTWNDYLGAAVALQVRRTRTFKPNDTGNFSWR